MVLRPGAGSLLLAYKCELDFIKTTFLSFGDLFIMECPENGAFSNEYEFASDILMAKELPETFLCAILL